MATSTTISGLTALGAAPASTDLLPLVDVSDTSEAVTGTTKRMTVANLFTGPTIPSGGLTITAGGLTVTAGGITVAAGTSALQALTATSVTLGNGQFFTGTRNSGSLPIPLLGFKAGTDLVVLGHEASLPDVEIAAANTIIGTAALATNATNGFVYMPSCAGTPTGVPTGFTGRVPWVFDTTNNKIYIYNGAWKATAALT